MFDTKQLAKTSSKRDLHWRQTELTLLRVSSTGEISQAYKLDEKRSMLAGLMHEDCLLAIRTLKFPNHPEVLVVDDVSAVRSALK
jgi:hypothetical protein